MAALRSKIPRVEGMAPDLFRYLEECGMTLPARDDLPDAATTAEAVTAFNTLLEDLRDAKKMAR